MAHHETGSTRRRVTATLGALVAIAGLPLAAAGPAQAAGEAERWTATAPLTVARYAHTATRLTDGNVLVAGGTTDYVRTFVAATRVPTETAEVYKPATGKWTNVGPLNVARASHTATPLDSGKVLVAGGFGADEGPVAAAEVYEPTRLGGSFWLTPLSLMNEARGMHTATKLSDGRVFVTGGLVTGLPDTGTKSTEIYNPADGKWTTMAPMNEKRFAHTATLVQWAPDTVSPTRVLVTGGWDHPPPSNQKGLPQLKTAELYDPVRNTWTYTGSMVSDHDDTLGEEVIGRAGHVATYIQADNTVLLVGAMSATNKAERYYPPADGVPANGVFKPTGNLVTARGATWLMVYGPGVTATVLAGSPCGAVCGKVLVAGSGSSSELYDPGMGTWALTGDLSTPHQAGHSAALLGNGRVLVAGGNTSTAGGSARATSSSELYFPVLGSSTAPVLNVADAVGEQYERNTTRQFVVSLSAPSLEPVTVRYATENGSATAPHSGTPPSSLQGDYVPAQGSVVIPSGALNQTVTVAVLPDLDYEQDERFSLVLSEATYAMIGDGQADALILNDDSLPATTVSISDAVGQKENDAGLVAHEFTVALSAPDPTRIITVDYSTAFPQMESGDIGQKGTVVFSGGSDSPVKTIRIYSQGDGYSEPDETFSVRLSRPTNTVILDGVAFGTIVNDDGSPPSITVSNPTVTETDTATAVVFAVTVAGPTKAPVSVHYRTVDGTAKGCGTKCGTSTAGYDFLHMPADTLLEGGAPLPPEVRFNKLVFPPSGAASQTQFLTVPIFGDKVPELVETFTLSLFNPDNGVLPKGFGTATIIDND